MADFDSADCLARLRRITARPDADADLTESVGYGFLSDAQRELVALIAQHVPWVMYTEAEALTASVDLKTHTLTSGTWLGRVEITDRIGGDPLLEGPSWDTEADFTLEGENGVRITGNRTHSGTLYARYVARPGLIDSNTEPVLKPLDARLAMIYKAAADWARRGGTRDPRPYEEKVHEILWGDRFGGAGVIPGLKRMQASSDVYGYSTRRSLLR